MEQIEYFGKGSIENLEEVLVNTRTKNIFLVKGKSSYESSGAKAKLNSLLHGYQVTPFSDFKGSPNLEDVEKGIAQFKHGKYDLVVAVGGGSVIDTAKAINILAAQSGESYEYICKGRHFKEKGKPLVAIPTTAGSGSEATHFAVIYVAGGKYSLAHSNILPDYSIIDPELTHSLPPKITAESGIDALSQAIEAHWSVNSTEKSKEYSNDAIKLIWRALYLAVKKPNEKTREEMSRGANFAGEAINLAKTTAPHAISYFMTSQFDIPHGHAVGLTLPSIFLYNSQVADDDCNDPRGAEYVRQTIQEISEILGAKDAKEARDRLTEMMHEIGLETDLYKFGIETKMAKEAIANSVNAERLKNNPRKMSKKDILSFLS